MSKSGDEMIDDDELRLTPRQACSLVSRGGAGAGQSRCGRWAGWQEALPADKLIMEAQTMDIGKS